MKEYIVVIDRGFTYEIEEFDSVDEAFEWVVNQPSYNNYFLYILCGDVDE